MDGEERVYIAIDLKSFYASAECVDRGLDPLNTNLVVADTSRTDKTICLAVSPSLKAHGIPGRPRLFEVKEAVARINALRKAENGGRELKGSSCFADELNADRTLGLDFIAAVPRMRRYMELSRKIFGIYLRFVAPEDAHVYSVDEIFIDATTYMKMYGCTGRELAERMVSAVLEETGITATAGIGTNLYLCKVAMDIVAKHIPADERGVRIAELNEMTYRETLWDHRPLTDFWRVGRATASKLEKLGIRTMGDICRCSIGSPDDYFNEDLLYRIFGIGAELLIDHAWGYEPCLISDIKAYVPENNSMSSGQVLKEPYDHEHALIIVKEMADALALDLVASGLKTDQIVLNLGYDTENVTGGRAGNVKSDWYGRKVPAPAHGSVNLGGYTSSAERLTKEAALLYGRIADPGLTIRRINVTYNHVVTALKAEELTPAEQPTLFSDEQDIKRRHEAEQREENRQESISRAVLDLKRKFGKNAVLKGVSLEEGATAAERNAQVGGHRE